MPGMTVAEIAQNCGGTARGDPERMITGANSLEAAGPADVSFVANVKAHSAALRSQAGCLITDRAFEQTGAWSVIQVPEPRRAFAQILRHLYPRPRREPSVHPTAIIAESAEIGADCSIGPYVVIGENARIGARCFL